MEGTAIYNAINFNYEYNHSSLGNVTGVDPGPQRVPLPERGPSAYNSARERKGQSAPTDKDRGDSRLRRVRHDRLRPDRATPTSTRSGLRPAFGSPPAHAVPQQARPRQRPAQAGLRPGSPRSPTAPRTRSPSPRTPAATTRRFPVSPYTTACANAPVNPTPACNQRLRSRPTTAWAAPLLAMGRGRRRPSASRARSTTSSAG